MSMTLDSSTRVSLLLGAGDRANQEARAAFVERYEGLIREWCRRWGLQDADQDDLVQTILCRLLEKLPTFKYDPTRRFRGLLHTAVSRAIVDLHRARQRRPGGFGSGDTDVLARLHEVRDSDNSAVKDLAEVLAVHAERDQQVQHACGRVRERVKPHNWQAFWLTTVEAEPVAEVARRLGMTNGAVLVAKHRVIKMIQAEFVSTAG
jgi:RNA polymerase sigma factor (sigma-70 family)